jgi:Flp pilus assembly protein TadG
VNHGIRNGKSHRREAGTSTVEMAIVLPLLLILCFGIGEFGLAYTQWQSLTNATREGARAGVVFRAPCNAGAVTAQVQATVDGFAASAGVTPGTIATTVVGACAGTGTPLTVAPSLPHTYIALQALAGLAPNTNLRARTVMRNE